MVARQAIQPIDLVGKNGLVSIPGLRLRALSGSHRGAGETIAAAPSIRAMAVDSDNGLSVLVTTMTPTGSEQVTALLGDTVGHCYAPYDFTFAVRRFLTEVNPRALILMETEIWPNLILEAKARGIPVILVNARLSEKSARGYQRLSWLSQRVLECFDLIACQTAEHAQRFIELGASAEKVQTVGNVKYDLEVPADTKEQAAMLGRPQRRYWIAASTHPGERHSWCRLTLLRWNHIRT